MKRQQTQRLAVITISSVAALVVIPIVLVILFIIVKGISAISWEFITAPPREGMTEGGIMPAILGTVYLTFGTAIVSIPLAIGAAIYLAEYATENRLTRWVRLAIVNLAGIPSIVYGLFGLGAFVLFMKLGARHIHRRGLSDVGYHDSARGDQHCRRGHPGRPSALPGSEPQSGGNTLADYLAPGASTRTARHPDRRHTGLKPGCWRDSSAPVYSGGLLPAGTSSLPARSDNGTSLPSVRDLNPGP